MAEIEASLLAKVQSGESMHGQPVLVGFLRSRKKRIGTLIEATSGQSLKELKKAIKKKGGKKLKIYQEINTIYAEMPVDKVESLSTISCAQHVYDAEGDVRPSLYESVPLVMGVERYELPYRVRGHKVEGKGVKVAVIDSGIDKSHPDFGWRVKASKNFSGGRASKGREHGTHVAGIIAGSGKVSGYRHTGVAPKATLYDAKVFMNADTPTSRDAIIDATLWAVKKGVDVINMSFGDSHGCSDGSCPLCKTADYAASQGITVVAAAGNVGPAEGTISCPGNARDVITVGASTKSSPAIVMGFSSRGSSRQPGKPDVVAPGDNITAPQPGKSYTAMSGTSMATPHVSGIAALIHQTKQHLGSRQSVTPFSMKETLKEGCLDLGEHPTAQGSGLINFEKELSAIQAARKPSGFFKGRQKTRQNAPVSQSVNAVEEQEAGSENRSKSCPASISMFCPYDQGAACQSLHKNCLHYHAAAHMKMIADLRQVSGTVWKPSLIQVFLEKEIVLPNYLGTTSISGKLRGSINGKALSGVSVRIGRQSTTTDYYGKFRLNSVPKGVIPVMLEGSKIYPRRIAVNAKQFGPIKLDAIEKSSDFNLNFYRELARGNWERQLNPIYRWTRRKPPTFYIDTNDHSVLAGKISTRTIRRLKKVIKKVAPVFSGHNYRKLDLSIKVKAFSHGSLDFIPDYSIVISFDDSLYNSPERRRSLGITHTSPLITHPGEPGSLHKVRIYVVNEERYYKQSGITREEVAAHEIGHGFGFRHTSVFPSIMNEGKSCGALFTEHDKIHMKLAYQRPIGNTDIDNDLLPGQQNPSGYVAQEKIFVDSWGDLALPEKQRQRLEELPGPTQALLEATSA